MTILVADDEAAQRRILSDILSDAGYNVATAEDGQAALERLARGGIDIVLSDLKMPNKDGLAVLRGTQETDGGIPVIIMTAFGTIPSAVEAIKNGAYDYLTKPFKKNDLLHVVERAADKARLQQENRRLRDEISERFQFHNLIGKSPAMRGVFRLVEKAAGVEANVLVGGESGTGKELVARAIHFSGPRKEQPFVAINCGAIPENLIESELFGHEKGAFTGARESYPGKFEQARGGTLFLDEIGTMRPDLQTRLLRVLQERKIQRLGGQKVIDLNVRVVAASNEELSELIGEGRFREDLFHRLNVINIVLPPLRERKEDIALLVRHFLQRLAKRYKREAPALTSAAMERLEQYNFPGNVRELENIIEKTLILNENDAIDSDDLMLPEAGRQGWETGAQSLPEMERRSLVDALRQSRGSIKHAASLLGISYKTMQYRMKKYNLAKEDFKSGK